MVKSSNQIRSFRTLQWKTNSQRLNQKELFLQKGKQRILNILRSSLMKPGLGVVVSGTAVVFAKEKYKPKEIYEKGNGNDDENGTGETSWSRVADQKDDDGRPEPDFDWKEFFRMLWPECWYFLGAIAVSSPLINCTVQFGNKDNERLISMTGLVILVPHFDHILLLLCSFYILRFCIFLFFRSATAELVK
jgi:hypothetical protein